MASFAKVFDNIKLKIYEKYSQDPAALCIFTGALGWALSCAAQVGAVVFNDKLSQKDKSFLVPQEVADGAVNVGLFLGLTTSAQKLTNYAFESGKIMFSETKESLNNVLSKQGKNLEQALCDNGGKISNILKNTEHIDKFIKLKGGACLATALLASIVSCNILTPIARNLIGSRWQKKLKPYTEGEKPLYEVMHPAMPLAMKLNSAAKKL